MNFLINLMSLQQHVEAADFAVYGPTCALKLKHQNVAVKHLFMSVGHNSPMSKMQVLCFDKSIISQCVSKCLRGSRVNTVDQLQSNTHSLPPALFLYSLRFSGSRSLFLPGVNNVICHRQASM